MLHAATLELQHPLTGQLLGVAAPLPDDFREEAKRRGIDGPATAVEAGREAAGTKSG